MPTTTNLSATTAYRARLSLHPDTVPARVVEHLAAAVVGALAIPRPDLGGVVLHEHDWTLDVAYMATGRAEALRTLRALRGALDALVAASTVLEFGEVGA